MTDNIIKRLISLGCVKINIDGTEIFPTHIINGGNGYVVIDGNTYNSNNKIEIISVDIKKLKNIFDSLQFIIKFNKDVDTMTFSEVMSIGILKEIDNMENDIDRITHLKSIINYNFKDLINTTPIIMDGVGDMMEIREDEDYEEEIEVENQIDPVDQIVTLLQRAR